MTVLKPCTVCGTPSGASRCPRHRIDKRKAYGTEHRRRRRALRDAALYTLCPLCLKPMLPGQALDLDHTIPLADDVSSIGDRITHASCNRGRRPIA